MNFLVLLEILGSFEGLFTNFANVRFEWCVDSEVASDVITLGACGDAVSPLASETEIVGALPAYVIMAQMIVESLRVWKSLCTIDPLTVV